MIRDPLFATRETQSPLTRELRAECEEELWYIGNWWLCNSFDPRGGFIGEIAVDGCRRPNASKGIILNTRLLWFFSEAALHTQDARYRGAADRAWDYLIGHFLDPMHGGVFWELDAEGRCLNGRKQTYAQAFALYAASAYFKLTHQPRVLNFARSLFTLIEERARDGNGVGYVEAFSRDWQPLQDVRLSDKDMNAPRSMNTCLHLLEAFTAFYRVQPGVEVALAIRRCLQCHQRFIFDSRTSHLRQFFTLDWEDLSQGAVSYGHDIEASWLLWEAVEALSDRALADQFRPIVLALVNAVLDEGVGPHGELFEAYDPNPPRRLENRVWWIQAEALVGFYNAYQLTGDGKYLKAATNVWTFIKHYQKDRDAGEWHWHSTLDGTPGDYKVGFWKGPYHNGRAMIELSRRLR